MLKYTSFKMSQGCDNCKSFLFEDTSCDCPDVRWVQLELQIPRWEIYVDYLKKRRAQAKERMLIKQVERIDFAIQDLEGRIKRTREKYL